MSDKHNEKEETEKTSPPSSPIRKIFDPKFATTSRFVVSSRVWMNAIPTRNCDVLMTFSSTTDDSTLLWLLARLRSRLPEISVHVRHHSNTGFYGFYLTSDYHSLLKGAEESNIRKPLKHEFGGGSKEFVFEDRSNFDNWEDSTQFLSSQERQSIVRHWLFRLRAVDTDQLGKTRFHEGQAIIPILISKGIIKNILPLHNSEDLHFLRLNWVRSFFRHQPLGNDVSF